MLIDILSIKAWNINALFILQQLYVSLYLLLTYTKQITIFNP